MVRVHYDGGGRYRTSGHTFEDGDIIDVDEQLADSLCEQDAFGRVEGEDTLDEAEVASEDVVDTLEEADSESEGFDVDAWIDEHHYQKRAELVRDGAVDDHLDAINEAESATTVQDAVGERRAEIEG